MKSFENFTNKIVSYPRNDLLQTVQIEKKLKWQVYPISTYLFKSMNRDSIIVTNYINQII